MIINANGNNYFVEINNREMFYLHPIIAYLLTNNKSSDNIKEEYLFDKSRWEIPYLKNIHPDELRYYFSKYVYLKKMKILELSPLKRPDFNANITREIIDHKLANQNRITFEITENCNLRCEYCGYGEMYNSESHYKKNVLSLQKVKTFLNFLHKARLAKNITKAIMIMFYGGEPLMKLNLIKKIVNFSNELFGEENIDFGLTTNGMLLNEGNIDYLVKNNFRINLSLDGNAEENSYRKDVKGRNSYPVIISNFNNLRKKCTDKYLKKNVKIYSVMHDKNSRKYSNFIFKEYNIMPELLPLSNCRVKSSYQEKFKKMNLYTDSFFKDDGIQNYFKNYEVEDHLALINKKIPIKKVKRLPTGTCIPFNNKFFVTVDGKILVCQQGINEDVPDFGIIDEDNVRIFNKEIIKYYKGKFQPYADLCSKCHNVFCTKCLFTEQNTHNLKNILCKDFLDEKALVNKLESEFANSSVHDTKSDEQLSLTLQKYIYIESYVYIKVLEDKCLIFNMLDGSYYFTNDVEIVSMFSNLLQNKNFLNVEDAKLAPEKLNKVVLYLKKNYLGDVIATDDTHIPFYLPKSLKMINNHLTSDPMHNLNRLVLYLDEDILPRYVKTQDFIKNKQLSLNDVTLLVNKFKNSTLSAIELYSSFVDNNDVANIVVFLSDFNTDIRIGLNTTIDNFEKAIDIKDNNKNLNISYHVFSDHLKEKYFTNINTSSDIEIVFLIESDSQLLYAQELIEKYNVINHRIKPIYNNSNIDFFESSVYLDPEDFADNEIKRKEIYANQIINRNYFGNLYVFADGSVKTTILDNKIIGRIDQDFVSILRSACQETSNWFLTRNKVEPCRNCCFNELCPPISDYELQIGKYNLCNINL